jgi:hypothetical protein
MTQTSKQSKSIDSQTETLEIKPPICSVTLLEKSKGPYGEKGDDWYRYVIDTPGSNITGFRRGKKSEVVEHLNDCIQKLEERMAIRKRPRASSAGKAKA